MTTLVTELLRHLASGRGPESRGNVINALQAAQDREFQWSVDAGFGPLLHELVRRSEVTINEERWITLQRATVTAKLYDSLRTETACDVLDICDSLGAEATLLKGISVSRQLCERSYVRPMGDVDILVDAAHFDSVQDALLRRGYVHGPPVMGPGAHHGEPLRHPHMNVWVEIHHSLFPTDNELGFSTIFQPSSVASNRLPSRFEGRRVWRLTDEFQLAYIASYCTRDLTRHSMDPSHVMPLADAARLLRNEPDWRVLMTLVYQDELPRVAVYLLLKFFDAADITRVPVSVLAELETSQRRLGTVEVRMLTALIHHFLVAGEPFRYFNSWHVWAHLLSDRPQDWKWASLPWNIIFPPSYRDRYNWSSQLHRARRLLRRLRSDR